MAASSFLWALVALLLPPLPVLVRKRCSGHLVLNIILLLLAWFPAVLHAWYVIVEYDKDGNKKVDRKVRRAKEEEEKARMTVRDGKVGGNQEGWYAAPPSYEPTADQSFSSEAALGEPPQGQEKDAITPKPIQQQGAPLYAGDVKM